MVETQRGNYTQKSYFVQVGNYNANSLKTPWNALTSDCNYKANSFTYHTSFTICIDNSYCTCGILGFDLNNLYNSTGSLLCPYPLNL